MVSAGSLSGADLKPAVGLHDPGLWHLHRGRSQCCGRSRRRRRPGHRKSTEGRFWKKTKVCFDVTLILTALCLSFLFFGSLQGLRNRTLISALIVGKIVSFINRRLPLVAWVKGAGITRMAKFKVHISSHSFQSYPIRTATPGWNPPPPGMESYPEASPRFPTEHPEYFLRLSKNAFAFPLWGQHIPCLAAKILRHQAARLLPPRRQVSQAAERPDFPT